MYAKYLSVLGLLLLPACDAHSGNEGASGNVSAEGKSEANTFSIKAPGVDINLDLPAAARANMNVDSDSDLLYPGSTLGGVHIEGGRGGGAVEIRFTSGDAPEKLFAWYRNPARTQFTIEKAAQEGNGFVLNGREKAEGDRFKIRLSPKNGGGTDGTLSVVDSN